MKPILLILAAGMGSRYGGVKQIASVGMHDETLLDYAVYDAMQNGFGKAVFVIRKDIEADFRERFFNKIARNCNAEYVFQSVDSLLTAEQIEMRVNRTKPWGTAHAMLCAEKVIQQPFAVINADDYYGRLAYQTMSTHLSTITTDSTNYAMVGYVLENTMSKAGSVSRGICQVEKGMLLSIREHTNIAYSNGRTIVSGTGDHIEKLTGHETVSMNFFGFSPKIFEWFHLYFDEFLKKSITSETAECFLSDGVGILIQRGLGTIKCYTTIERWFGMTYPAEREIVKMNIANKIRENYYPEFLWK
ncbi:MAG: sugar phosphate nucleotidyltransferase [Treponema sp.]